MFIYCRLARRRIILTSDQASDLQTPSLCPATGADLGNVSLGESLLDITSLTVTFQLVLDGQSGFQIFALR